MLKGAQKRMIVVKTSDSKLFEEAYFVMRTEISSTDADMVCEANRIIEGCKGGKRDRGKRQHNALLATVAAFIGGSVLGVLMTLAVVLVCR